MSQNLGIGVSVYLRDLFSAPAARINSSMQSLSRGATRMSEGTLRAIQAQNTAIAGIGVLALRGMGNAVKVGAEFGRTMNYIGSISDDAGVKMGALSDKALELGRNTMFTAREIGSGMRYMAMAGMTRPEILGNIEAATNLAGATMTALGGKGGAADIMTNVMRMFQLTPKDAGMVSDVLTTITSSANTNLFDLGEAMKYAGDTMHGLKIPMSETAAMLGILGDSGIQGSMAGTALANMYRYLGKAIGDFRSKRQSKAMAMLGLTPQDFMDAQGNLLGTEQILKRLLIAAQGKTTVGGQSMMEAVFGIRGKRASTQVINNLDRYKELMDKIGGSQGRAGKIMNKMMNDTQGNIDRLVSAWESFKIQFSKTIEPIIVPAIKVLTGFISLVTKFLDIPIIGTFFGRFALGFTLVKTVAAGLKVLISSFALIYKGAATAFQSRVATTVAGYNAMTAAAGRYRATAAGPTPGSMAGAYYGQYGPMGQIAGRTSRGTFYRKTAAGGTRFIRSEVADRYYSRYGAGMMAGQAMGRTAVGRLAGGAMGRLAGGLAGRALGFLGGPWGIAISVLLPILIEAITGNTDELRESNNAKIEAENKAGKLLNEYLIKGKGLTESMGYSGDYARVSHEQYMKAISNKMGDGTLSAGGSPAPVKIYIDGLQTTMEKVTEDTIKANLEYTR